MVKNPPASVGDMDSIPGSGRVPRRKKQKPTSVFLLGKFHGRRSLVATVHGIAKELAMTW